MEHISYFAYSVSIVDFEQVINYWLDYWHDLHKSRSQLIIIKSFYFFSLGSACSHVAALLFKLEACCRIQENKSAVTSQLCKWNRSRKSAEPSLLKNINFKRPKKDDLPQEPLDKNAEANYTMKRFHSSQVSIPIEKIKQLKQIVPNAAFFKIVNLDKQESAEFFISSDTDTANHSELNCIPEPLTSFYDATAINLSSEKLAVLCAKIYGEYVASYSQVSFDNLTEIIKLQNLSSAWKLHRGGRITASNFHEVCHQRSETQQTGKNSLLNKLMNYTSSVNTPALNYGRQNESRARKLYQQNSEQHHNCFVIKTTGLHVRSDLPFIGASPDALIECKCHGKGLLEIKCPRKYRDGLKDWEKDKTFPINADKTIKTNHKYYSQIVICDCDLFIWTPIENSTVTVRVLKDDKFCKSMLQMLKQYFFNILLPELVTRKFDLCDNKQENYCYCKWPCFESMIARVPIYKITIRGLVGIDCQ